MFRSTEQFSQGKGSANEYDAKGHSPQRHGSGEHAARGAGLLEHLHAGGDGGAGTASDHRCEPAVRTERLTSQQVPDRPHAVRRREVLPDPATRPDLRLHLRDVLDPTSAKEDGGAHTSV